MIRTFTYTGSLSSDAHKNLEEFWALPSYKAGSAGGFARKVSPEFTSQACSKYEHKPDKTLYPSQRKYRYGFLGYMEARYMNAPNNVLRIGLNGILREMPKEQGKGRSKVPVGVLTAQNSMPTYYSG